jgi:hypothetical protein
MIPRRHAGGGVVRPRALVGGITSGYNTTILKNQPVLLNTNGTLNAVTTAADFVGTFAGVEYNDSNGIFVKSTYWPANTSATNITAYFFDDPQIEYEIQSDATLAATAVGDQADVSNFTAGSTTTGLSACTLGTLVGAGNQGMLRITELALQEGNAFGDSFVNVLVRIARHQFVSNKVAV